MSACSSPSPTSPTFNLMQHHSAERSGSRLSQMTSGSTANLVEPGASQEYSDWSDYYWSAGSLPPSQAKKNKKAFLGDMFYGWRMVVFGSWLNLLLILLPTAWVISVTMKSSHDLVFALCTLALIPLVKLHDLSTRDLAIRIGGAKTGLVNASLSNIVEIVLAISALRKCELQVVQSALVGSILIKLLLILGLCFFAGGLRFSEQGFDATATQVHSSLLNISVSAILIPVAFHFAFGNVLDQGLLTDQAHDILQMSHGVSVILLLIYAAYLLFQLWSHSHLYHDDHNQKSNRLSIKLPVHLDASGITRVARRRPKPRDITVSDLPSPTTLSFPQRLYISPQGSTSDLTPSNSDLGRVPTSRLIGGDGRVDKPRCNGTNEEKGDLGLQLPVSLPATGTIGAKEPQMSWQVTLLLLITVTAAVAVTADWLVGSLDGVSMRISKPWVGLILLPVVSSIAECITTINVSVKDQLTLSVSVALGSALQTALFVIPFLVVLGWISNKPLSLLIDPFQSLVLYISVQTAGHVIADGKSNWLEGMMLICLYAIVAVSFWFYPGKSCSQQATPPISRQYRYRYAEFINDLQRLKFVWPVYPTFFASNIVVPFI